MEQLSSKICTELIASILVLNGIQVSDFIALYLYTDTDQCYMIFLDDENNAWKVIQSKERPKASDIDGDEEFKYIYEDIAAKYNLRGKYISNFIESDKGKFAEGILTFSDSSTLTLVYGYKSEKSFMKYKNK